MIVQRLKAPVDDKYEKAERYYMILSAVNDLKLTPREIQLMAFTAIRGNMSYATIREDFCNKFKSTSPTINNIISKLKKIGVLIKKDGKIKVNPVILLDFDKDVQLDIKLIGKKDDEGQTT